jgi:RNA polymerase sigma-70 factor (ECF subfamily)
MSPPRAALVPDTSWTLLRSVQDGSREAWARLVSLYAPVILRWCRRHGLQNADADNVVQDVFLTLSRHLSAFRSDRGSGRFRAFLSTITRTRLADHHRREARQPLTLDNEVLALLEGKTLDEAELDPVFRDLELRRTLDVMRTEVAPTTWEAFWRTAVEGRSSEDVAASLGLSAGAVRLARLRILRRLRHLLQ